MTVFLVIGTFAVLMTMGVIVEKLEQRKKAATLSIGNNHVFAQDGGENVEEKEEK